MLSLFKGCDFRSPCVSHEKFFILEMIGWNPYLGNEAHFQDNSSPRTISLSLLHSCHEHFHLFPYRLVH